MGLQRDHPGKGKALSSDAMDLPAGPPPGNDPTAADGAETPMFRLATLDDAPEMLRVLEAAFERWPEFDIDVTPLAHLQWKMSSPVDGLLPHTVGTLDGQVIAAAIRWASYVHVDGRVLSTSSGADQAIHPDYQGRGFAALQRAGRLKLDVFGELGMGTESRHERLVNSRQRRPESRRARQELVSWTYNFDRRGALGTGYRSGGILGAASALVSTLRPRRPHAGGPDPATEPTVMPIAHFDEQADRLWELAREQFDVARVRNAAYLNWRYADPRSGRSQIFGVFEDDPDSARLAGYSVLRLSDDYASLADLLVEPGRENVAAALVRASVAHARELGCRRVVAWLPTLHPLAATLATEGFVDGGVGALMSFHQLRGSTAPVDLEWFRDPARRLHVTLGDHDFV